MNTRPGHFGWQNVGVILVVMFTVLAGLILAGCGGTSEETKKEKYEADYSEIMDRFQAKVSADDKRLSELAAKNDIAGIISLDKRRITYVEGVLGQVLDLEPPVSLRKLHTVTLYYMESILDQLDAQNNYWDALLSGKPSNDLKTIAETAAAKTQAVGTEFGLELEKAGIQLKIMKEVPQVKPQGGSAPNGGTQ